MLVSRWPVSRLDPAFPFWEALSNHGAHGVGDLMVESAIGLAVSVDADQVLVGSVVPANSQRVAGSTRRRDLLASGFASSESGFSDKAASVDEYVQPAPRGSSLVASFRLLQSSPRNGFAMTSGAKVPCLGPSGGTAWRL